MSRYKSEQTAYSPLKKKYVPLWKLDTNTVTVTHFNADTQTEEEPKEPEFTPQPLADEIGIEKFGEVDLRVAKVLECEKVKKSKKLLKLQLDDGMGGRQVVSGIAPWYKPEDLIGKKIMLVANLKPAKLCGVESCGMICAADMPNGDVKVIFPDDSLPVGAKIR